MSIYDVQGRFVTRLVDRVLEPGRYRVLWDGRGDGQGMGLSTVLRASISCGSWRVRRRVRPRSLCFIECGRAACSNCHCDRGVRQ